MTDKWKPFAVATMVGSMPDRDREKVIETVLREFPEVPAWPQLSAYPAEQMMNQYLEGLPGICSEEGRLFMDTAGPDFESDLLGFYEEYFAVEAESIDVDESRFGMGEETGCTFLRFLDALSSRAASLDAVKGQIVGPFTFLTAMKDREGRALIYNDSVCEAVPKHLGMKARWQIRRLKRFKRPVILFLDEPALAGFGSSALISISAELVEGLLAEVIDAVHKEGALAGVHVCANTDWRVVYQSGPDIINFDAFSYFDRFSLYRDEFKRFLSEGHCVAWGMVPTLDRTAIAEETPESLAGRWRTSIQSLVDSETTLSTILSQSLFTPSCGCGSLPGHLADRVLSLTHQLSAIMRG